MDCSCNIEIDTYGTDSSLHTERFYIAKKEHKCIECGRTINAREKYLYTFGIWDNKSKVYKTCLDCLSIREQFFHYGWHYEYLFEYLWNFIVEVDGAITEECIRELTPRAQEIVCEMIERCWGEE